MDTYIVKFGKLKGLTPEEAFEKGEIEALIEYKNSLIKNLNNPNYKKLNLEGYLAVEEVLLKHYQPLLKKFNELFAKMSNEQKKQIDIDFEVFYKTDIIGIQEIINQIESIIGLSEEK